MAAAAAAIAAVVVAVSVCAMSPTRTFRECIFGLPGLPRSQFAVSVQGLWSVACGLLGCCVIMAEFLCLGHQRHVVATTHLSIAPQPFLKVVTTLATRTRAATRRACTLALLTLLKQLTLPLVNSHKHNIRNPATSFWLHATMPPRHRIRQARTHFGMGTKRAMGLPYLFYSNLFFSNLLLCCSR